MLTSSKIYTKKLYYIYNKISTDIINIFMKIKKKRGNGMNNIFIFLESLFSGVFPFVFLMIVGLYFTFKSNGYQFRNFFKSMSAFFEGDKDNKSGVSSFGAVCTSLSATVGTGNIAGVASAISVGGAGAVFWMWISALVGMCVKSAEIVTAILYRDKDFTGGPMYYIKKGLPKKFFPLSFIFCVVGIISCFCTGNITQINASVLSVSNNMVVRIIFGVVFAIVTAFVIIGGINKITAFTSKIVPFMAVLYIILCFGVILKNFQTLPLAFADIFKGAFNPSAVTGGAVGSLLNTVITGAKKGVFSNEAGLGTAGMAHSSAVDATPQKQGLFGVFEVFVDTILICTLTALTILCSGVIIDYGSVSSSELVKHSLFGLYGSFSSVMLSIMLCLFGISSVIGWSVYGIQCTKFLLGQRGAKAFIFIYPLFCIVGAVCKVETAWRISEFFNGIMLIINLFAVIMLSGEVIPFLKGEQNDFKNRKNSKKIAKK